VRQCGHCRKVYQRSLRNDRPGYVYLFKSPSGYYKIGASEDVEQRHSALSIPIVFELEIACTITVPDMFDAESDLHTAFKSKEVAPEWFALDTQDVEYIKSLAVQS
jgi:hypothetical protein